MLVSIQKSNRWDPPEYETLLYSSEVQDVREKGGKPSGEWRSASSSAQMFNNMLICLSVAQADLVLVPWSTEC